MPDPKNLSFAFAPSPDGQMLLLGLTPECAADVLRHGEDPKDRPTKTLDLSSIGIPIKLILCGVDDHAEFVRIVQAHNEGAAFVHVERPFGIEP